MNKLCREAWLEKATELLRPYFKERRYELPEEVRLSCGWPSSRALSTNKRRLGECWHAAAASDGVKQIFISPVLDDSLKVLDVLVHELIHAALPDKVGHKGPFKKACEALGLEGPATSTQAGPELTGLLKTYLNYEEYPDESLPPYPQAKLDKTHIEKEKKQTTRMRKLLCAKNENHCDDDIIVRASSKVLKLGVPNCFCGREFVVEETEEDEN